MALERAAVLLAGLWAGGLLAIAALAAPAAFAVLAAPDAGRLVGRIFAHEAALSLALAIVLLLLERRRIRAAVEAGRSSALSANMLLALAALFCTVAGYYALQPMMAAARAGQGTLSFGALHAISSGFYGLKTLLVLALAWRLSAAAGPLRPGPTS